MANKRIKITIADVQIETDSPELAAEAMRLLGGMLGGLLSMEPEPTPEPPKELPARKRKREAGRG